VNLSAVMDALGDRLAELGLRAFPYWTDRVEPPFAIVGLPDEYEFDATFGRGSDRLVIPVMVGVSRVDARTGWDLLSTYVAGSGAQSVKAALENVAAFPPLTFDSLRVMGIEFGAITVASVSYLGATFNIEILGRGA
jgi:hypothetical protein